MKIENDNQILELDFVQIEEIINKELKNLSLDQKLLLWSKSLKMKFDEQTINKLKTNIEKELDKINNLYELKRVKKKIYDLNLDTTYINNLKRKFLLKEMQNPNTQIGQIYTNVVLNSKNNRDE